MGQNGPKRVAFWSLFGRFSVGLHCFYTVWHCFFFFCFFFFQFSLPFHSFFFFFHQLYDSINEGIKQEYNDNNSNKIVNNCDKEKEKIMNFCGLMIFYFCFLFFVFFFSFSYETNFFDLLIHDPNTNNMIISCTCKHPFINWIPIYCIYNRIVAFKDFN